MKHQGHYRFRSVVVVLAVWWCAMAGAWTVTTPPPQQRQQRTDVFVAAFQNHRVSSSSSLSSFVPTAHTNHIMTALQSSSSSSSANDDRTTSSRPLANRADLNRQMSDCVVLLQSAAVTKQVDPDQVYQSLITLEQLARQCNRLKDEPEYAYAQSVYDNLHGSWRLIFTTGTAKTQSQLLGGAKINYFPIKAVQTFNITTTTNDGGGDDDDKVITNAIYIGDFVVLQFRGTFDFDIRKCQLTFDFDEISLFNHLITIPLPQGKAAELGAASGLGSASNVVNIQQKKKKAFFNWISANDQIATARGGGGGLALWKRV